MALGDYLSSLNLDPAIAARLTTIGAPAPAFGPPNPNYGPPAPGPMAPPDDGQPRDDAGNVVAAGASSRVGSKNNDPPTGYMSTRGAPGLVDMRPAEVFRDDAGKVVVAGASSPVHGGAQDSGGEVQDVGGQGPPQQDAPAHQGVYVPSHWQPGTRSEAVRYGMDPDALAPAQSAYESATGHGIAAGDKRLEAAQMAGMADAVYASAHAQAAQSAAEKMRRMENEKQAYVVREGEKLDDLTLAAQQKIDPDAAKGSMGSQILAAIAVGLGQFGASLNGGQNTALQIVNGNIDRQIRAQEMNISNAKKSLGDEQSLYKQNLEAFGDRERAVLATKVQYLEQVRAMADQQYAAAKSSANEGDKHAWDQKLMEQKAEYKTQFAKITQDVHETNVNEKFVSGQVVGGGPGPKKDLPNLVTLSDGTTVQMPNEKQQDKAIEKIQVIDKLQRYSNEALNVRKEIAKVDPILDHSAYSKLHKQLEDLEETKVSMLSTEAGQGVLRDSEYARSVARQGFYTQGVGFFKGNPVSRSERETADANIRRQIQRGDEDQRAFVRAAGGHVVERGYATGPDGQRAPVAQYTGQDVKPAEQLAPAGFKPLKKSAGDIPTADTPLGETTPRAHDFGRQPVAPQSAGKDKGGKGSTQHVKGRK